MEEMDALEKAGSYGAFETIDDVLAAYYDVRTLNKANDPILTGTSNYRNILYGKKLWLQMNVKPNAFTLLPREAYDTSGYRLAPDFATTATTFNGVAEAGTIPESKKPTLTIMEATPKTLVNDPYQISMAMQKLQGKDDVVTWDEMMKLLSTEFPMRINTSLLKDVDTLAGNNLESIDRVCSSYAEVTNCGITAGDSDYLGLDRDAAASYADAYVNHNSNTDREFKLSHVDACFTNQMPYWNDYGPEKKVILTGFDTIERMQTLAQSQQRFMGWVNHVVTYNGVKSIPGEAIGFGVSQYRGVPVVADMYVAKDTLSRVYLLDTNFIKMGVLVPPTFIEDRSYIARGNLTTVATYYMLGELIANKFRVHGKVRDLL